MKASPNREQLLFLITGGIILVLILVVVIFNMVRTPADLMVDNAQTSEPKAKVGDRSTTPVKTSWLTQVTPAPIFNTAPTQTNPEPKNEIISQDLLALDGQSKEQKNAAAPNDKWNSPEASSLEAARLNSTPVPKDNPIETAQKKPAPAKNPAATTESNSAKPHTAEASPEPKAPMPMPQMAPNFSSSDTRQTETKVADAAPKQAASTPPKPVVKEQEEDADNSTQQANPKSVNKTNSKPSGFVVQLASYNDEEHVTALTAKLSSIIFNGKRMPTFATVTKMGKRTVHRVFLGPFITQNSAQQAANLAHGKTGLKGLISGSAP